MERADETRRLGPNVTTDVLIGLFGLVAPLGTLAAKFRGRGSDVADLPKRVLEALPGHITVVLVTIAAVFWLVATLSGLRGTRIRKLAGWALVITATLCLLVESLDPKGLYR